MAQALAGSTCNTARVLDVVSSIQTVSTSCIRREHVQQRAVVVSIVVSKHDNNLQNAFMNVQQVQVVVVVVVVLLIQLGINSFRYALSLTISALAPSQKFDMEKFSKILSVLNGSK
uniref:Uncharacterized protein n=1 Tax=Glossina brevipalpis TaxID=37001 RepID=A0A1A9WJX6_9MUSC